MAQAKPKPKSKKAELLHVDAVISPEPVLPRQPSSELEVIEDDEMFPEDFPDYFPSGFVEYLSEKEQADILEKREDTRGRLALIYTVATFIIFGLGFLVAVADGILQKTSIVDNLTKLLPLISGIFLGTLGFVLGYYFRRAEGEDENYRNGNNNNEE
jgi:hypothetical protein